MIFLLIYYDFLLMSTSIEMIYILIKNIDVKVCHPLTTLSL